jgi:hypothetical protein
MPNDKETIYDFADITKADSEKWKIFRKDTMNQVMKSFGPIGALTDPDNLDEDDEPDSDLWGLKNMPLFLEYFNSDSTKSFNEFKKTWFQTQMSIYMTLDKSFRTSDCELVNKYSYASFQAQLQNYIRDSAEANTAEDATHLYTFAPFGSFLLRALEMKHGKEEATDVISMLLEVEKARKSFKDGSKAELQKFCNALTTSHFNLQQVIAQHDPEHLAALQTLIVIYNQGGNSWREWVKTLLVQPEFRDKSLKIADITKAIMKNKAFSHTAQIKHDKEEVHFTAYHQEGKRGGRRGGRQSSRGGGRNAPPNGRGAPSNFKCKCANPNCKTIVNHPHHRFCNSCFKSEKKAKQDDEDDDHLGSTVANEV